MIDMERRVVVAGQEEDETSLLVKDTNGNIIKGVPVYSVHCCVYCGIISFGYIGEGCQTT